MRIHSIVLAASCLLIGFLCGALLTTAHSADPTLDFSQVVAQMGDTRLTRGRLAEFALEKVGDSILNGELLDIALVEEAARKNGIQLAPAEVQQRIDEMFKFAESAMARKRLEAVPRQVLTQRLRAVLLTEKMLNLKDVSPNEAETYFTTRPQVFFSPALAKLICIATSSETDATRAFKRLRDGEDARKLSEILSADKVLRESKGDLGWFARASMSPQVAEAIFDANNGKGLRPKEFTKPLEHLSETGAKQWLIFYVEDFQASKQPSLEEVRPAATFYARAQKYSLLAPDWFIGQAKGAEWKRVKSLFDPAAPLEASSVDFNRYQMNKARMKPGD